MWSDARRAVISFFYPNRCPFCGGLIGALEYYCIECAELIRRVEGEITPSEGVSEMFACCEYTGRARDAVLRLKDGAYVYSVETIGMMMTENIGGKIREYDALVPVPSSFKSILRRRYAPAEEIAREISKRSGVRVRKLLYAADTKDEQKRLSTRERILNADRSFTLAKCRSVRGMRLLLVDDIRTTGATLSACASLLRKAGAAEVGAAVFAVSPYDEKA